MENEESKTSEGKKSLPIIIVVAILVLAAGAYFLFGRNKSTLPTDSVTVSTESSVGESFTGTLKDAIALGVGMRCTYMFEGIEYEGFVRGENYRGEMMSADGAMTSVIVKDNCMWTWEEGSAEGMTFCTEEAVLEEGEEVNGEASIWDQPESATGSDVSYDCNPAAVSDSQFTPPSDVEFLDPASLMGDFGP